MILRPPLHWKRLGMTLFGGRHGLSDFLVNPESFFISEAYTTEIAGSCLPVPGK